MAYRDTKLGPLVRSDPKAAARLVRDAMRTRGSIAAAAQELGVSLSSLKRILVALEALGHRVARRRPGEWSTVPGRPPPRRRRRARVQPTA